MSTGLECYFFRVKDGVFYVLQDWNCPVGAYDWCEYATAYGPFTTMDKATQHLSDNHANPGGYSRDDTEREPREVEKRLIEAAKKRPLATNRRGWRGW